MTTKSKIKANLRRLAEDVITTLQPAQIPARHWQRMQPTGDTSYQILTVAIPDFARLVHGLYAWVVQNPSFVLINEGVAGDTKLSAHLHRDAADTPLPTDEIRRSWTAGHFVLPFLIAYFERTQGIAFDEGAFDSIFETAYEDISREDLAIRQVTPLLNMDMTMAELRIEPGLRLRRIRLPEVERWINYEIENGFLPIRTPALYHLNCCIEDDFRRDRRQPFGSNEQEVMLNRDRLLSALRLLSGRRVALAFTQETRGGFDTLNSYTYSYNLNLPDERFVLDAEMADELKRLWVRLRQSPNSNAIDLSLRRLNGSTERIQDEDRLIDYWIALESLFTPDGTSELRFRASLRIAAFIGHTRAERVQIYDDMRLSYDWRSCIVHGDQKHAKSLGKKRGIAEVTRYTGKYLRDALKAILDSDEAFNPRDIESKVLSESIAEPSAT